jgi:hypothetical protein
MNVSTLTSSESRPVFSPLENWENPQCRAGRHTHLAADITSPDAGDFHFNIKSGQALASA